MAGSGDQLAAGTGDRNRLRASDADRERVAEVLKAAFVQGRLTVDEFTVRVTRAYASRTYAALDALIADIPARLQAARPPAPAPAPDREKLIRRDTAAGAAAGMVIPAVLVMAVGGPPGVAVLVGAAVSALVGVLLPAFLTFIAWVIDRDSRKEQGARGIPMKRAFP